MDTDLALDLAPHREALVALRRDLHAHPEVARTEARTTARVAQALTAAGLVPRLLPGTGLVCDVGPAGDEGRLALRADLDALPLPDETGRPWASTVPGVSHACGHDVHTAVVVGAGLLLAAAARRGELPRGVRLVLQPAEEATPGGALDVVAAGGLDGVSGIVAVHCDPSLDVGRVGLRSGPITSAADHVLVRLTGPGGHTSRPHVTGDLVFALGTLVTGVPGALSRRSDPRSGVSLVWGRVAAGQAYNAIPRTGEAEGTVRYLRAEEGAALPGLVPELVRECVAPFGVQAHVAYTRGVPPVVNDEALARLLERAAGQELGPQAPVATEQSLGGEDFAWYLESVPGALARLGTRTPGGRTYDLHQGDFDVDERAIGIGARVLAAAALLRPAGELTPAAVLGASR